MSTSNYSPPSANSFGTYPLAGGAIKVDPAAMRSGASALSGVADRLMQAAGICAKAGSTAESGAGFPEVAQAIAEVISNLTTGYNAVQQGFSEASGLVTQSAATYQAADAAGAASISGQKK